MSDHCHICCYSYDDRLKITTPCHHMFCLTCLLKLQHLVCPFCRKDISAFVPNEMVVHRPNFQDMIRMFRLTSRVIGEMRETPDERADGDNDEEEHADERP